MKSSFWPTGDYPIFINPDFAEIAELAKSGWDTVRICVDNENIGVASGYGNTHQSVIDMMRVKLDDRRLLPESYILFKEDGDFWFNCEDMSGERKLHYKSAIARYFDSPHDEILSDLVNNS